MKKAKASKRISAASSRSPAKLRVLAKTVDEYLARVPEPARSALTSDHYVEAELVGHRLSP